MSLGEAGVLDDVWAEAAGAFVTSQLGTLLVAIAAVNAWNRLAIATHAPAGRYVSRYAAARWSSADEFDTPCHARCMATRQERHLAERSDNRPPWKRKNPADTHTKLTPEDIAEARARARAAGRTYPNLIDNMAIARKKKEREDTQPGGGADAGDERRS